ncbi:MAG: hypothetical protein OXC28_17695 [Defluviicoccus sp.]|nr:hypothetical protein [Defluviicoccus sp.]
MSGAVRTVAQQGKSDMTPWEEDVNGRRRIRADIKKLESQAGELEDAVVVDLHQALVRAESRESYFAREASLDLSYAANECCDPDLRERIEEVRRDLHKLVFPQP